MIYKSFFQGHACFASDFCKEGNLKPVQPDSLLASAWRSHVNPGDISIEGYCYDLQLITERKTSPYLEYSWSLLAGPAAFSLALVCGSASPGPCLAQSHHLARPWCRPAGGEWRGRKEEKAYHSVMFRNLSDTYIAVIFRKSSLSLPFLKGNSGELSESYL